MIADAGNAVGYRNAGDLASVIKSAVAYAFSSVRDIYRACQLDIVYEDSAALGVIAKLAPLFQTADKYAVEREVMKARILDSFQR